ncbi:MAG TPA: radical SAM protein [Feifaniaceae bacterium]|nr:radical SAM protein [Feifaniaceae bacterium]
MAEPLNLRRLAIMPTLKCTLRCKLCSNYMTMFGDVGHVPVDELTRDVNRIFELIDHTEWLQFVGGEIFMRRDLDTLYEHCLTFKSRFDKLILITNATLLPSENDIAAFRKYGEDIQIQISDYGVYSPRVADMAALLELNSIPHVVKRYHGDMQHYGGWVDNTRFAERGKSEEALREQFEHCGQVAMRNFHMYRGKLHGCARSLMAAALGKITPAPRDELDLYDPAETDEEKREKIRHFNDFPRVSCRSCISFGEHVERFAAAEQVKNGERNV